MIGALHMQNRGNAGLGRPKGALNKATAEVKDLAQAFGPIAIHRLAALAGLVPGPDGAPKGMAQSERAQVAALIHLLDRAYGKPTQTIAGEPENPVAVTGIEIRYVDRPPPETREQWIARKQAEQAQLR